MPLKERHLGRILADSLPRCTVFPAKYPFWGTPWASFAGFMPEVYFRKKT